MPMAVEQVRRMRGGAQSHLMRCDDGGYYIVKFQNNPQGVRVLANELLGTRLAARLGIPVPGAEIVTVREDLIRYTEDLVMQLGRGRAPCTPGKQFGSRFPGSPAETAVSDFLPEELLRGVTNLEDFCGILAFDKWTCNTNGRQAIFFRTPVRGPRGEARAPAGGPPYRGPTPPAGVSVAVAPARGSGKEVPARGSREFDKEVPARGLRSEIPVRGVKEMAPARSLEGEAGRYRAVMIDQGFCFNAGEWNFPDAPLRGLYARHRVYEGVRGIGSFEKWIARIEKIGETAMDEIAREIPPEWYEDDLDALYRLMEQLLRRRTLVPELVRSAWRSTAQPFPNWR